ncbi:hypothetical protein AOY38_02395 [Synechocystis sp. PCC 6803]|nr:hypothetical protein AOY38_02395 [Synechocystis sp. PCC 6803]
MLIFMFFKLSFVNLGFLFTDQLAKNCAVQRWISRRSPLFNFRFKARNAPTASNFLLEIPRGLLQKSL